MKTNSFFTLVLILISFNLKSQNFQWATSGGSPWYDEINQIAMDSSGNYYLTGYAGSGALLSYDRFYYGSNNNIIGGESDILLAKVNSSGNFEWVVTCGSRVNQILNEGGNLYFDKVSNSLYFSGSYVNDDAYFGNFSFPNGPGNVFARMDLNGNFIWVKPNIIANHPAFDKEGNFYLLGYDGQRYLSKTDSFGNNLWTKYPIQNGGFQRIYFLNDTLILTGTGTDNLQLDTATFSATDSIIYFISAFDTLGNLCRYTKIVDNPSQIYEYASNVSENGLVHAFRYSDTINFATRSFFSTGNAFIISKHNLNGQFEWAKRIDYSGIMKVQSIENTGGSIYITGYYEDQFLFDSTQSFTNGIVYMGRCFVMKLDENGNYIDGFTLPKSKGYEIVKAPDGGLVLVGTFRDTLQLGSNSLISYGYNDIFITKMDSLTSISETYKIKQEELLIYANPNTGNCRVVLPDDIHSIDNILLTISDISGRIIFQGKPQEMGNEIVVNLEQEASGKYFVQLTDGKKIYRGVIIFEK